MYISIVTPAYRCSESLKELHRRLVIELEKLSSKFEIIMVNDGSPDNDWDVICEIAAGDKRVKGINLSRNFGHQIAVTAGMDMAEGDVVIIMDADLQDPPEVIARMIEKYKEGYHVVYAVRKERKNETFFKKTTAKLFYRLLRKMSDIKIPVDTGDFRLISKEVNNVLKQMKENNRYIRGLVSWAGFPQTGIEYVRDGRYAGTTQYTLRKLMKFSLDGLTSFSTKPLEMATVTGFIMSAAAFVYAAIVFIERVFLGAKIPAGWATLTVLILLVGGIQMIMLGIVGEYIGRIYDEAKDRPLYVVKEIIGDMNTKNIKE